MNNLKMLALISNNNPFGFYINSQIFDKKIKSELTQLFHPISLSIHTRMDFLKNSHPERMLTMYKLPFHCHKVWLIGIDNVHEFAIVIASPTTPSLFIFFKFYKNRG